jgi:hypothetical protein
MTFKILTFTLSLLAIHTTVLATPFQAKPGLWETTTTTERKGARPPANLDQLTPDQRAQVEQQLAEKAKKEAHPVTHTAKACLTAQQIQSGEVFARGAINATCTRSVETQTASEQVVNLDCKGGNPMAGKVELHATDAEHMTGSIDMTYGPKEKLQMLAHTDITSHWLGEECGEQGKVTPGKHPGAKLPSK